MIQPVAPVLVWDMLTTVFDRFEVGAPVVTSQGFLKIPAFATRSGIFVYKTTDGKSIRVYRSPKEVFNPASMDSLRNCPVTRQHRGGLVTPDNFKQTAVGYTGDTVEQVGNKLGITVFIADSHAILDVQQKRAREISAALVPKWIPEPGQVTIDGKVEAYDMLHEDLIYNHVSLVDEGRAGPEVRLLMDSKDEQFAVMDGLGFEIELPGDGKKTAEDAIMVKVKINGVEFEVTQAIADALSASIKIYDTQLAAVKDTGNQAIELVKTQKAALDAAAAKVDVLTTELTTTKAALDAKGAPDVAKFNEAVKVRATVMAVAKHLVAKDDHAALDAKTNGELKKLSLKAHNAAMVLDGKSEDYINAAFDMLTDSLKSKLAVEDALGSILLEKRTGEAVTELASDEVEKKTMDEMTKKVEDGWKSAKSGATKDSLKSKV